MGKYKKLSLLPPDTGGKHKAYPLGSTEAYYGYYSYIPSELGPEYPLLIFLHGVGEKGNSEKNPKILNYVLRNGPPLLIEKREWHPNYPMIVISPQTHDGRWNAIKIHEFIRYLIQTYDVNQKRIYLSGLSMGAFGTFNYLTYSAERSYVAAAIPICGGGNTTKVEKMIHIPIWAFHGETDPIVNVSRSIDMVKAINVLNPSLKAKLTIFPKVGHNSWTMTYNGKGMNKESKAYDPYDMNIYDWLFLHEKQ